MSLKRTMHLAVILSMTGAASPLAAQSDERPELTGHVVSAETGEAVPGAFIALQGWERGTYSWRDGHFRLPNVPAGPRNYFAEALGYQTVEFNTDASLGDHTIELAPDASLQDGLDVLFDRLADRRNGGRVFDRQALAFSGSYDLGELLTTRGVRGLRKYCLDERYAPGLANAAPGSFYLVEIHGRTVRAYTEEFLESMAREAPDAIRETIPLRPTVC